MSDARKGREVEREMKQQGNIEEGDKSKEKRARRMGIKGGKGQA